MGSSFGTNGRNPISYRGQFSNFGGNYNPNVGNMIDRRHFNNNLNQGKNYLRNFNGIDNTNNFNQGCCKSGNYNSGNSNLRENGRNFNADSFNGGNYNGEGHGGNPNNGGSARAVNRRYISDCVPLKTRLKASAAFVSASALGMSCGPALAGALQFNKTFLGLTLNQNTLPGWVMAASWAFYLVWLWICFQEPLREEEGSHSSQAECKEPIQYGTTEEGLTEPLVSIPEASADAQDESSDQGNDGNGQASKGSLEPANSICEAYKLITWPVKVLTCLGILISLKVPIQYTVAQYVTGGLIMFVSAEVLEGVSLSLLSKVMSSRLSRGTYNGGLLSTEAGTLARVLGDASITLAGYLGMRFLLNTTLLPTLLIGIFCVIATCYTYNSLF